MTESRPISHQSINVSIDHISDVSEAFLCVIVSDWRENGVERFLRLANGLKTDVDYNLLSMSFSRFKVIRLQESWDCLESKMIFPLVVSLTI